MVAESCRIILDLCNMCNNTFTVLYFMIKLLSKTYIYKDLSGGFGYMISGGSYVYIYIYIYV
jgi:hypothetical protein